MNEHHWIEETLKMKDVSTLHVSSACVGIVKYFEGFEPVAYLDPVGIITLGFGETLGVQPGDTITEEEAAEKLVKRLDNDFAKFIRSYVQVPLTQYQFDALASFIYNVGGGAFQGSTLLEKLNKGDYEGAAHEFPKWKFAGGKVLKGLENRRKAEQALFEGKNWKETL